MSTIKGETIATEANGPAIELEGLTKHYGGTAAVENLTLAVPRGTTLGLIGPNGAGKSTTIKMLMGMLTIDAGRARILGLDVSENMPAIKQRIGYVPELHQTYRWMRISELIGFTRSFYKTWNDDVCDSLLDLFGLDRRKKVKQLSKGMLTKVSLLLAVSHEPEVLILDEPMSGLDPLVREEFLDGVLRVVCERQCTVLFSSHALGDVQRMADNVAMLYDGKLLVHCPVDELLSSAKRVRAVLRDGVLPRWQPPETIWQQVQRREWLLTVNPCSPALLDQLQAENPVEHVEVNSVGLEDLFKDYVKGRRGTP
jgi:ABC-2 type transport system ATP-binding protein